MVGDRCSYPNVSHGKGKTTRGAPSKIYLGQDTYPYRRGDFFLHPRPHREGLALGAPTAKGSLPEPSSSPRYLPAMMRCPAFEILR